MTRTRSLSLKFPIGGVVKRGGYTDQAPYTTPEALNMWPTDWETGRERGGSRPGLTAGGSVGGAPYNWCTATWSPASGGVRREVAVTASGGTYVSNGAGSFTAYITSDPGSDFSSCAVYLGKLFQAASGGLGVIRYTDINSGPSGGTVLTATAGTAPTNCGLIVAWGDRLVAAGDYFNPSNVYACAIGAITDWDYSPDPPNQSMAWSLNSAAGGLISDPITSLIPHNRDCLLIGCTDSLWVLRGNPAAGGQAYTLSHEVGPLEQSAWCKTGNDYTLMLTRDGLYSMRPGCGEPPVSVSREKIPEALMSISPESGDKVALGYDHRWRGVHIYVSYQSGSNVAYFYDLQSGGFWPMSFGETIQLCPSLRRAATADRSGILPISSSGRVYQFDRNSGESFVSRCVYGPIKLGGADRKGHILEATAALPEESDQVSWSITTGASAEESYNNPESFVGSDWDRPGLNYAQHPRVGGAFATLKIEASGSDRISPEEITLLVRDGGRRRVQ